MAVLMCARRDDDSWIGFSNPIGGTVIATVQNCRNELQPMKGKEQKVLSREFTL